MPRGIAWDVRAPTSSFALALSVLLGAVLSSACGPGTPAPVGSAQTTTVEVPVTNEQPEVATGPEVASGPTVPVEGLAACVADLRAARDVEASDEARSAYDTALAAERRGDLASARRAYFELVQRQPSSKLIPLAYLAFGEMFAAEAETDPAKWEIAKQAYLEVLKYPAPDNPVWVYAQLRRGDALRPGRDPGAIDSYSRVLAGLAAQPDARCAAEIRSRARAGLIEVFAEVGAPDKAFGFFRVKLGDADGRAAMRELVEVLRKAGRAKEACEAARAVPNDPDFAQQACR